jgi:ferredoxin-NADP reductase
VREVHHPSESAVLLRLEVADRIDHLPGQHYVVRLRADDGYVAQRSYSVASPPADPLVELYIARLEEGEVSTFLADVVEVGDELEVRGPIGGWFVWDGDTPALGIGGGSGVVPLVSMLRHAAASGRSDRLHVVAAARSPLTLPYADELTADGAHIAYSRVASHLGRPPGRLGADDLRPLIRTDETVFVCGSAAFAEATGALLLDLGVPAAAIRVERFGPSGL